MNVVIVCDFAEANGGAAQVAVTSARALADAGLRVTYVAGMGPVSPWLDHPRIRLRCLGFDSVWRRSNPLAAASQGVWNGAARVALEEVLNTLPRRETVVHFHQWSKALSPSVFSAPRRYGLAAIVSLHDYFFACPNGAFYHFGHGQPCTRAPLSMPCLASRCDRNTTAHKAVRVARQVATRHAVSGAGTNLAILSMSAFAERIVNRFIPDSYPRYVLPAPIEVECAPPARVAENSAFLFVGRLTEEKGILDLARLASGAGLPLTIVGDGPLRPMLEAIGGSVRCTGWLDRAGVTTQLETARALIFPSRWYETGGLVVGEARARGVPPVVSSVTAPAEDIVDGVTGLVVPPAGPAALLTAMRRLTVEGEAARMGLEAYRRYWQAPRTAQWHAARLIEIYRTMLGGGASCTPDTMVSAA